MILSFSRAVFSGSMLIFWGVPSERAGLLKGLIIKGLLLRSTPQKINMHLKMEAPWKRRFQVPAIRFRGEVRDNGGIRIPSRNTDSVMNQPVLLPSLKPT